LVSRSLLVFGLSGQIGDALLPLLAGERVQAVSRQMHANAPGVQWEQGDLSDWQGASRFDAVLSLGPLDAFARAVVQGRVRADRIVAFGSTSVHVKHRSPDRDEQDVARRLAEAESSLTECCRREGIALFVLRPTLVWGAGRDATLSRVVALARRWPFLPLPLDAPGLRQPVHVTDLAQAALAALDANVTHQGAFDLAGGETLRFGAMLGRAVQVGAPNTQQVPVPWRLMAAALRFSRTGRGFASRFDEDLCFDTAPAKACLGWSPRGFQPESRDFPLLQVRAAPPY
jgi:nucleoside-diphosphate-sugar epimerase